MRNNLVLILVLISTSMASAHNKVVVIPLIEDASRPDNIVSVARSGGDFTSINSAMSSIVDATSTNRYIIFVGPGSYSISNTINLKSYVSIVGSGPKSTLLTSKIDAPSASLISCDDEQEISISELSVDLLASSNYRAKTALSLKGCAHVSLNRINLHVNTSLPVSTSGIYMDGSFDIALNDSSIQLTSPVATKPSGIFFSVGDIEVNNSEVRVMHGSTPRAIFVGVGGSINISNSSVYSIFGSGVVMENNGEAFHHYIRNSTISSIYSNQENIFVSHSTVRNFSGSRLGLSCIFSDNGSGVELNHLCAEPTP